ncbi:MAG: GNAT family N-acetyltransferase [Gemmatimonadetes bacterium]|nr:GNAT family N-acetyltransferase [Gemmatimonadota bacterium]
MTVSFDLQPTLHGTLVRLVPLRDDHFDALFAVASDPDIWAQHPAHDRWQPAVFRAFFDGAMASRGAFLVYDAATGAVIGSTRYHDWNPETREVEIGWTFLARSHWGGRHNGEMKQLLLQHAFQWADRVRFHVGVANIRSRTAVERIGGVLVGERVEDDGRRSVVYHITAAAYRPPSP